MPDDARAHDALTAVAVVATRVDSHEKVCAERYGEIKGSFDRVHSRLDKIMLGVLGLLLTMVGWLLVNGVPWKGEH
jgi:predicted nucleic acid-binding Zn ribbon protein